jgi:hypothetical protein
MHDRKVKKRPDYVEMSFQGRASSVERLLDFLKRENRSYITESAVEDEGAQDQNNSVRKESFKIHIPVYYMQVATGGFQKSTVPVPTSTKLEYSVTTNFENNQSEGVVRFHFDSSLSALPEYQKDIKEAFRRQAILYEGRNIVLDKSAERAYDEFQKIRSQRYSKRQRNMNNKHCKI